MEHVAKYRIVSVLKSRKIRRLCCFIFESSFQKPRFYQVTYGSKTVLGIIEEWWDYSLQTLGAEMGNNRQSKFFLHMV